VRQARQRCWRYDWVLDIDVKAYFDSIDWELMLRAVRHHTSCPWVLLYIERWLKAPQHVQSVHWGLDQLLRPILSSAVEIDSVVATQRMVSPGVAQAVLSNTEALAEAARSDGRVGYESASDDTFGHRFGFHVALFLYRRFGLVAVGKAEGRRQDLDGSGTLSELAGLPRCGNHAMPSSRDIFKKFIEIPKA
jgi:hypothetical protein